VGFLRAVRQVRGFKADLALSMSPPKRNTAVTLLSGARCKVGYLTYHDSVAPYLETTPIEAVGCEVSKQEVYGRDHIEERSLKICRALGVETRNVARALQIESSVHTAVCKKLVELGVLRTRPCIVLHPFSGWEFRSWPLERFVEVTNALLRRAPDYDIVLVCEKTEETRLAQVAERYRNSQRVRVFASEDLLMTSVLLREAALVVGNDSGPLHLAAALGTPVVGLFGPALPELTAPRSDRGVFHYRKVECSPCDQRVCVQPNRWCMSLISVDAVVQSIVMQLSPPSVVEAAANA
ncbi:MAG TPA: glycosyltransferase family 9 protein, partial [Bacteroidota bacterium]|nr:glycosyltransferase family 9 protein [Bacteroidota bacterium]